MTYELAKQLKDAGFPQEEDNNVCHSDFQCDNCKEKMETNAPYFPTLSELIEACGHLQISNIYNETWIAKQKNGLPYEGSTPEEAVANLWLELNKKK